MSDLTPSDSAADSVRDQDKIMLVLSYFGIFALIPYFTVKDSAYVKWHAKQGVTFFAVAFAAEVALAIVFAILTAIIHVLGILGTCMFPVIGLGILVVAIMAMVKAIGGERWRIPVIADLADKW